MELRCKETECQCSPKGKLLVKVYNLPDALKDQGVIIEVPCPKKKSKTVELKIQ
jgi:hypothetical protein